MQMSTVVFLNPMEPSPSWEANSHSASPEILRPLRNKKFHYRLKSPPLVPFLGQLNLVHIFTSYFFKINFNIILLVMPRSLT